MMTFVTMVSLLRFESLYKSSIDYVTIKLFRFIN